MSKPKEFNYGGQAVIEGVMMRGSKSLSVAVRSPSGEIVTHTEMLNANVYGGRIAKTPFLRGLTLLWDALGLGVKSLMFSADVALEEEGEEDFLPVLSTGAGVLEADLKFDPEEPNRATLHVRLTLQRPMGATPPPLVPRISFGFVSAEVNA